MRLGAAFVAVGLCLVALLSAASSTEVAVQTSSSGHTNNWAVLVCTSRFWFNYRHVANTLSVYRTVKRLGIPDSNIILMLADDIPCNARNSFPAAVFNNANKKLDLYGNSVEVDYRGYDVTVNSFIQLMTNRLPESYPASKRLLSDANSNVLVYMTGHGGDEFLKFQDADEISGPDLADIFEQMHQQKRYRRVLFMTDTCQGNTLFERFYSPNIIGVGSAERDQNSYSHHTDPDIGVSIIDRFTYHLLDYMESIDRLSSNRLSHLFRHFQPKLLLSTPGFRLDLLEGNYRDEALVTDFFGATQQIESTAAVAADVL